MNNMFELLKDPKFWTFVLAFVGFCWSVTNSIIGKLIANKITQNDLVHLTADVVALKAESKEYKGELKEELNKIFKRLGRIEKNQARQDAICDERHRKTNRQ